MEENEKKSLPQLKSVIAREVVEDKEKASEKVTKKVNEKTTEKIQLNSDDVKPQISINKKELKENVDAVSEKKIAETVTETKAQNTPAEPAKDKVKAESVKAESVKAESVKTESVKAESPESDAPETEAAKAETPVIESPKTVYPVENATDKTVSATENDSEEDDDDVVFAGGEFETITPGTGNVKEPETFKNNSTSDSDDSDDEGETDIVFAAAEKKKSKKAIPVQKEEKRFPVVPVVASVCALLCVGAVGAFIALNPFNNAVETVAETSSKASKAESSAQISVKSEAPTENTELDVIADEPLELNEVDTTNILFGKNVTVEGIDLSGLTLAEAYDAMQDKLSDLYESISISVACDGKTLTLTENDFVFDSDLSYVLVQAYHYSRGELSSTDFQTEMIGDVTDFKVSTAINSDSVDAAIKKAAEYFDVQPVNARVTKFDPEAAEKFTYADGSNGFLLDHEELENKIKNILDQGEKTGSFSIQTVETPYEVSLDEIKANTKLIASHATYCNNSAASVSNMQLAIRAASGTVIEPGKTFSFNEMTGDTTNGNMHYYDNGTEGSYVPSTAYSHGEVVQDYGGGICQASTTIYLCALKAGMEIQERHAHMYASSYADYGLDATVDYGNLDMRFTNGFEFPVYIATYVYDGQIMVEMYGPLSTEYDEVVPVGWVTYADSNTFSAKGAQVFFKDGKEVKRSILPAGTYDYHFESYYSVVDYIPGDIENGPSVSPNNYVPTVYSPNGCGSSAPIAYGTASEVLSKASSGISAEEKKQENNAVVITNGSSTQAEE